MGYFELYKTRVNAHGNSVVESRENATRNLIESSFKDSSAYLVVKINGENVDARLIHRNVYEIKALQFKPDTLFVVGEIVDIEVSNGIGGTNTEKWIITNFEKDELFPRADIQLCNNTLTIQTGTTQTLIGYDDLGRPIYEETPDYDNFPCITERTTNLYTDFDNPINLPEGRMFVTIPYTDEEVIKEGLEFNMYGSKHKIVTVDKTKTYDNGQNVSGIIILIVEKIV